MTLDVNERACNVITGSVPAGASETRFSVVLAALGLAMALSAR